MRQLFGFVLYLLLACGSALAAAPNGCAQGSGEFRREVGNGYVAEFSAAGTTAGQCVAQVKSSDGASIFEITAPETFLNEATGSDINGDGKPDVVIESHRAHGQCCYTYSVVTPGATPALVREITTSVPLTFEDREGDGKIEISARDNAFDGFDGMPQEFSPHPLVIFRLRGSTLYYVSPSFWPEYERDITQNRESIPHSRLDKFKSGGSTTGVGNAQKSDALQGRELDGARAAVLAIVLDYLYGGKGQDAWKTLQEMWPYPDNQRIRQLILLTRSRGVLSEMNRQPVKTAQQPATQPSPH